MKRTCYLSALGDCKGKLTLEHPVPESYLIDVVQDGSTIRFAGGPKRWGTVVAPKASVSSELTPATVGAKILCERHNSVLGERIDVTLRRFLCHNEPPFTSQFSEFRVNEIIAGITKMAFGLMYINSLEKKVQASPLIRELAELVVGRCRAEDHRLYVVLREPQIGDVFDYGETNDDGTLVVERIELPLQLILWRKEASIEAPADKPAYEGVELNFWHGVGLLVWLGGKVPSSMQQDVNSARLCATVVNGLEYSVGRGDRRIRTRFV